MEGIRIVNKNVGLYEDIIYLQIFGYVDTTTSLELVQHFKSLMGKDEYQFVVDMSGVNYVSSAGWGVFVGEIKDIRENGGDIKIVHMTPEVYDVFEMLEFNRILRVFDSVAEAINEFDFIRGFDLTQTPVKELPLEEKTAGNAIPFAEVQMIQKPGDEKRWERSQTNPQYLPLSEKIKSIIVQNPLIGFWQIKKQLKSEKYGKDKIGYWKLRNMLKEMSLDTKERRMRFYRSR
ncbi:anti-sigma-B factor antagonist [bacterium BMS3Abin05]|nr:anti-sigma-B factor antagonist [bacterium BMS3Abin05]GBE26431.1 anti-sigma-B factor antagonist [bacterium BMS3Bbin03]HDL78146.1 anti-sigma factor antagonist [Bacteroidota bacterium]